MSAKHWPEKGETVLFQELTRPILKAIRFAYKLTRKNVKLSIPYDGYDNPPERGAINFDPDKMLNAANLRYSLKEQGRDALEEILGVAIRLGIEQGRRIEKRDSSIVYSEIRTLCYLLKEASPKDAPYAESLLKYYTK